MKDAPHEKKAPDYTLQLVALEDSLRHDLRRFDDRLKGVELTAEAQAQVAELRERVTSLRSTISAYVADKALMREYARRFLNKSRLWQSSKISKFNEIEETRRKVLPIMGEMRDLANLYGPPLFSNEK